MPADFKNTKILDNSFYSSKKVISRDNSAWLVISSFIFASCFLVVVGPSTILNYLFPSSCFLIGAFLYFKYPILYSGFNWWIWILTPLVRRLVDYKSGFTDPSLILLSPYLVTCIIAFDMVRHLPVLHRKGGIVFITSMAGIFYGFLIGIVAHPVQPVILALLEWIAPVLIGFYFFINWQNYPKYRKNIQVVFTWAILLTSIYGIYQYLVAPEWDKFWLINANIGSAGRPEPLSIRVWSTMNGPAAFAAFLMAGLLILLTRIEKLSLAASIIGYVAFLLTLVRAAWLGWLVGIISFFTSLKQNYQIRLILVGFILLLGVIPLASSGPFSDTVSQRLGTFTNLESDSSANARSELYDEALQESLANVIGTGLIDEAVLDSGIIAIFSSLGWIGSVLYLSSLSLSIWKLFGSWKVASDSFSRATSAIALGTFFRLIFGRSMLGVIGVFLWSSLGLSLAAYRYHEHTISASKEKQLDMDSNQNF